MKKSLGGIGRPREAPLNIAERFLGGWMEEDVRG